MDILNSHEVFEMEALEAMNSEKLLDALVFGGGTMLRLCHELNRYSVDLDFWFIKDTDPAEYFLKVKQALSKRYELTDACDKFNTLLFELRSGKYPRLLKIEIRKKAAACDWQEKIAYSGFSDKQVILKTHTLDQTMANKVEAALARKEIRDFFDIEFLVRKGINLPEMDSARSKALLKTIESFGEKDYKVKLGSIVDPETRRYYIANGFALLAGKLAQAA